MQFPDSVLQKLFFRNINKYTVKMMFPILFREQLRLDRNPYDLTVFSDQPVLIVDRVAAFQLFLQVSLNPHYFIGRDPSCHIISVYNR